LKKITLIVFSTLSLIFGPIFALIARTGYGADICMRYGFLPLPVHYYSPVPDIPTLQKNNYWLEQKRSDMAGIEFNIENQLKLIQTLGKKFGQECVWPEKQGSGKFHYYFENPRFGYTSACFLHAMIRLHKPKRVIEIGSGFSTLIISEALEQNYNESGSDSEFIAIEPYPDSFLTEDIPGLNYLIEKKVEYLPLSTFDSLGENDILFIDSSHVIRIGGEVNYLYLDVLPRLNPGVITHIHDIQLPYDYPQVYFTGRKKFLWTEQYLLQAFLINNRSFNILLAAYFIQKDYSSAIENVFPNFDLNRHRPSSSFYMKRVNQ